MGNGGKRGHRLQSAIIYSPLIGGAMLLILGRVASEFRGGAVVSSALLLIALSCFIYAAQPNSGEITDQQRVQLAQIGVDYRPAMGRVANAALGFFLSLGAVAVHIWVE